MQSNYKKQTSKSVNWTVRKSENFKYIWIITKKLLVNGNSKSPFNAPNSDLYCTGILPGASTWETPPMTRSWGEDLMGKADQVFKDSEKLPPALTLKMICLSDACFSRLLPNFCDTGRRPSRISFQIRINLEL